MDGRRYSTQEALNAGILSKPTPQTDIPEDREQVGSDYEYAYIGREAVQSHIEGGAVVSASNYYGIPQIWKEGEKYRGVLLQYRSVTADETFHNITDALDWFEETAGATSG